VLGIQPALTGTEITHEGLYVNQHRRWQSLLLQGLEARGRNGDAPALPPACAHAHTPAQEHTR
jgi:hypothetical protein